ncbi:MAG TPA: hypothetical protein VMF06_11335 [Candidatus Limnocylindria bacterium]|jgi:hypothetical protein|nr:hypothetical protein [Candidatus Limnocylindria bacterium]
MGYSEEFEKIERFRALVAETEHRLWSNREQLAAMKVDVHAEVVRLRRDLERLERHFNQLDSHLDAQLSEVANQADARRDLFHKLERLVSTEQADSQVDAARLAPMIEKLRKEMPRN